MTVRISCVTAHRAGDASSSPVWHSIHVCSSFLAGAPWSYSCCLPAAELGGVLRGAGAPRAEPPPSPPAPTRAAGAPFFPCHCTPCLPGAHSLLPVLHRPHLGPWSSPAMTCSTARCRSAARLLHPAHPGLLALPPPPPAPSVPGPLCSSHPPGRLAGCVGCRGCASRPSFPAP